MDSFVSRVLENFCMQNRSLVPETNARFLSFQQESGSNNGFFSDVYFGHIDYEVDGETKKSPKLFVKMLQKRPLFPEFNSFNFTNESFFYTQVLPFLSTFDGSAERGQLETVDELFPKYYECHMSLVPGAENAIMVFENLQAEGYKLCDKKSLLDLDHLSLMLRKLGQFHAYSYAAKSSNDKARTNRFHLLTRFFSEIYFPAIGQFPGLLPRTTLRGLKSLRTAEGTVYGAHIPRLEAMFQNATKLCQNYLARNDSDGDGVSVLCHGDYTAGNVLFKYDDEGKPIDMKMIDMANCRFTSPATDVSQILYIHTDQSTRDKHWHGLIAEYFDSLRVTAKRLTLVSDTTIDEISIPSKEMLMNELRVYSKIAYFNASYYLGLMIAVDNKLPVTEVLPPKYRHTIHFGERPIEVNTQFLAEVGGELGDYVLGNILKDMINRSYI